MQLDASGSLSLHLVCLLDSPSLRHILSSPFTLPSYVSVIPIPVLNIRVGISPIPSGHVRSLSHLQSILAEPELGEIVDDKSYSLRNQCAKKLI